MIQIRINRFITIAISSGMTIAIASQVLPEAGTIVLLLLLTSVIERCLLTLSSTILMKTSVALHERIVVTMKIYAMHCRDGIYSSN